MATPREVLVLTLTDLKETDVPPELREVAFRKVFDLYSGGTTAPARESTARTTGDASGGDPGTAGSGSAVERVAARFDLSDDAVRDVFHASEDGGLELVVGPGKLSSRVASATKEIALALAAARQAAGIDEWTSVDIIRAACADYKRFDSSNFAATIKEMEDVFTMRGTPRKRELRLARPGWERAAALIRRLAGAE